MPDLDRFKMAMQQFMANGLMLVIGSGLSCAEGLPGMGALVAHIAKAVTATGDPAISASWSPIESLASVKGLEAAVQTHPPTVELEELIQNAIYDSISESEHSVFAKVLNDKYVLPLSRLLGYLDFPTNGLPILTTNYDRLVELACEVSGISVDTLFDGQVIGRPDPDRWRLNQIAEAKVERGLQRHIFRKFVRVLKPHGSLDWSDGPHGPIRFAGRLTATRLMVTPGIGKYRAGYNEPFDTHRSVANAALTDSERLLLLGYGFNDDHLEATRLVPHIKAGKPALLLARTLTDNARALVTANPKFTAIEAIDPSSGHGSRVFFKGSQIEIDTETWWNLDDFVSGILE